MPIFSYALLHTDCSELPRTSLFPWYVGTSTSVWTDTTYYPPFGIVQTFSYFTNSSAKVILTVENKNIKI